MAKGLLRDMENEQAYLKAGIYGLAGAGKTWSASSFAIGLAKMIDVDTVAFFETETGSDYVKPQLFDPAGIKLVGVKSRAFADCVDTIKECEANGIKVLIIDSISHVWKELMEAYMKKHRRSRMLFQDWGNLKGEWAKLTDIYLRSKVHIFLLGRAGYEYDYFEDSGGDKQLEKTGVKMKAETEMGYEPSLLIYMERRKVVDGDDINAQRIARIAHIQKDRFNVIDGKEFENPTFEDVLPHVNLLNLAGEHVLPDPARTSEDALADKDWSAEDRRKRKTVALGEIKATFDKILPGTAVKIKTARIEVSEKVFGVKSWEAVENMKLEELEAVLRRDDSNTNLLEDACYDKTAELAGKTPEPKPGKKDVVQDARDFLDGKPSKCVKCDAEDAKYGKDENLCQKCTVAERKRK